MEVRQKFELNEQRILNIRETRASCYNFYLTIVLVILIIPSPPEKNAFEICKHLSKSETFKKYIIHNIIQNQDFNW